MDDIEPIQRVLGARLTERLLGAQIAGASAGISLDGGAFDRVRQARELIRLLLSDEEPDVIRAWLVSPHADLGGLAPIDAFASDADRVTWAALRFIGSSCDHCIS